MNNKLQLKMHFWMWFNGTQIKEWNSPGAQHGAMLREDSPAAYGRCYISLLLVLQNAIHLYKAILNLCPSWTAICAEIYGLNCLINIVWKFTRLLILWQWIRTTEKLATMNGDFWLSAFGRCTKCGSISFSVANATWLPKMLAELAKQQWVATNSIYG